MSEFLMKPKVDFAFKEIMMDEQARIGFLSTVLKIEPGQIKETKILNTNLRKEHKEDKLGILDVRVLLNDSMEIDIEIQLSELLVWTDRALFYLSKMYTEQIHESESYEVFKKCVSICILDFKLFDDSDDFYSCFHIREDSRHTLYTDKMEFHVIELPKLPKELKENSSELLLWAKFINAEREEEFTMVAKKSPYIQSAYKQLKLISQDREKRMEYEARQKAILDYNQGMLEANRKGRNQERAVWEKREQQWKQELEQAQKEKQQAQKEKQQAQKEKQQAVEQTAINLLRNNASIEFILNIVPLTRQEVEKIQMDLEEETKTSSAE